LMPNFLRSGDLHEHPPFRQLATSPGYPLFEEPRRTNCSRAGRSLKACGLLQSHIPLIVLFLVINIMARFKATFRDPRTLRRVGTQKGQPPRANGGLPQSSLAISGCELAVAGGTLLSATSRSRWLAPSRSPYGCAAMRALFARRRPQAVR